MAPRAPRTLPTSSEALPSSVSAFHGASDHPRLFTGLSSVREGYLSSQRLAGAPCRLPDECLPQKAAPSIMAAMDRFRIRHRPFSLTAGNASSCRGFRRTAPITPGYPSRVLCAEDERRNDTMDIGGWLRGLGLERYEQAFRENEIDLRVLPELTADDLKELGIAAIGHRRLPLKAIADLAAGAGHAAAEDVPAASPANATAEAERRQLTVMFCDLVGSTELSSRFDPEDLREIVGAYHRCVADTVGRFGGFVAKYMGDGVLVYFGYPAAHEDDAERAVQAGLELIAAVTALKTSVSLQTRVGIATGLVVVGDLIGSGETLESGIV